MIACLTLLPCALVALVVLGFRWSVLSAAILACCSALTLWLSEIFGPTKADQISHAFIDTCVLELIVGLVVLTGVLFIEEINRSGGQDDLIQTIQSLNLPPPRAVILIVAGVGVMLESLTGYGISMFVTVPILLTIVNRNRAMPLALIGMSLMSWGALSVSALLGAALSNLTPVVLAEAILYSSGPIAAVLPLFCLFFVQNPNLKDVLYAIFIGVALILSIALASRWVGVEVAGVGGGLAVILVSIKFSSAKVEIVKIIRSPSIFPFGLLITFVVLQKFIVSQFKIIGFDPLIDTGRVCFHLLSSPAIALIVVTIISVSLRPSESWIRDSALLLQKAVKRCSSALLTIFLFLMTARLLVEIGGIKVLSELLINLGIYPAIGMAAILGALGSYITGSGVASNALFMASAATTGQSFNFLPLFASLQHSAAAHAGVASLPIISILLSALPNHKPADEQYAMRIGLGFAIIWLLFVVSSGILQVFIVL